MEKARSEGSGFPMWTELLEFGSDIGVGIETSSLKSLLERKLQQILETGRSRSGDWHVRGAHEMGDPSPKFTGRGRALEPPHHSFECTGAGDKLTDMEFMQRHILAMVVTTHRVFTVVPHSSNLLKAGASRPFPFLTRRGEGDIVTRV
jgi:hypothetical protein